MKTAKAIVITTPTTVEEKFECVLCNSKLPTKESLQDHFRQHANKEIDSKGRPKNRLPLGGHVKVVDVDNIIGNNITTTANNNETMNDAMTTNEESTSTTTNNNDNDTTKTTAPSTSNGRKFNQPINCDVCGLLFENVTSAIQHKFRKHPNSSLKYYCPYCGMQFPLKYNRDLHVNTHDKIDSKDSFKCSECEVEFYTSDALSYHYKSTHKRIVAFFKPIITPPPSKKIRINNAGEAQSVFYCHLCGFEYIVKFNLQKHLERQHSEEELTALPTDLIKCTFCDALFYNKRAYENHNMYHKPDDLYVTSEEQRLQTVSRVDQDFDIRRVQLPADKFIPVNKTQRPHPVLDLKSANWLKKSTKRKEASSDSELSPDSSSMSSSDEDELPTNEKDKSQETTSKKRVLRKRKIITYSNTKLTNLKNTKNN